MNRLIAAAAGVALAATPFGIASAGPSTDAPGLRAIMEDLGRNVQAVSLAIAREDWPRVERAARRIVEHPQPPLVERGRILAFVGPNAGRFRDHDEKVRGAAMALAEGARARDAARSIASFADLQRRCQGCHAEFRGPFMEHFHGRP